jgi:hypothetical protein
MLDESRSIINLQLKHPVLTLECFARFLFAGFGAVDPGSVLSVVLALLIGLRVGGSGVASTIGTHDRRLQIN